MPPDYFIKTNIFFVDDFVVAQAINKSTSGVEFNMHVMYTYILYNILHDVTEGGGSGGRRGAE